MSLIGNTVSLPDTLLGLEGLLFIDTKLNIDEQVRQSIAEIEAGLGVKLDGHSIGEVRDSDPMSVSRIDGFMAQLSECLKNITLLSSMALFHNKLSVSMKDAAYLGFNAQHLQNCFKYLINERVYENRSQFLPQVLSVANKLETGYIRRLLVLVAVLDALGIKEGVCVLCQYLYIGIMM
jgi:hypothetical protein